MSALLLHEFHAARRASFFPLNGFEAVKSYGSPQAEYDAIISGAAVADLSFRGRVCLLGSDRAKFLHGQVTNDILRLKEGQGCYAALVTAKAKMESDLFIYNLRDELLLDFEPGLTERVIARLNHYIIADDVRAVDVAPHYGLLSVLGPSAREVIRRNFGILIPGEPFSWRAHAQEGGDIYVTNNPRYGVPGIDLYIPVGLLEHEARKLDLPWVGFDSTETTRIENGIPRYGADMNENTLPQEAELQDRAISFAKGCYIGQEIIARIRTYGQVAKALRLLRVSTTDLAEAAPGLPIYAESKNVGLITSATNSPRYQAVVCLGYVRKESFASGTKLKIGERAVDAEVLEVP